MSSRLFWSAIVFIGLAGSAHAGFIEICKDAIPAGSLSGSVQFSIANPAGTLKTTLVGFCTPAFTLPDGMSIITEIVPPGAIFSMVSTFPSTRLISTPTTNPAVVQIVPGDISNQTLVDFFNAPAPASIPEPGTAWLLGLGAACWAIRKKLTERQST